MGTKDNTTPRCTVCGWTEITPLGGPGTDALARALLAGKEGPADGRGVVEGWDPSDHLASRQLRRMSRISTFALVAASGALREAGWTSWGEGLGDRVDVVFASTHGATRYLQDFHEGFLAPEGASASPLLFTNGVSNAPAAHICLEFGFHGRNLTLVGRPLEAFEGLSESVARLCKGAPPRVVLAAAEEWSAILDQAHRRLEASGGCASPARPGPAGFAEGAVALVLGPPGLAGPSVSAPTLAPAGGKNPSLRASVASVAKEALSSANLGVEDPDVLVCSLNGGENDAEEAAGLAAAFAGRKRPLPVSAPSASLGEGLAFGTLLTVVAALEWMTLEAVPPAAPKIGVSVESPLRLPERPVRGEIETALVVVRDPGGGAGATVVRRNPATTW